MEHFTHCCFIQFMMSDNVYSEESCALLPCKVGNLDAGERLARRHHICTLCDVQMRNGPPRILEESPKPPAAFFPKGTYLVGSKQGLCIPRSSSRSPQPLIKEPNRRQTHHNFLSNGTKSDSQRPNRQAHRRRRPSFPQSSCRSCFGQQRRQVD